MLLCQRDNAVYTLPRSWIHVWYICMSLRAKEELDICEPPQTSDTQDQWNPDLFQDTWFEGFVLICRRSAVRWGLVIADPRLCVCDVRDPHSVRKLLPRVVCGRGALIHVSQMYCSSFKKR